MAPDCRPDTTSTPRRGGPCRASRTRWRDRWREPDAGIWEVRDDAAHHVHSKLMAWLALDRALRIADHHRTADRRTRVERRAGGAARGDRRRAASTRTRGSYTRSYGSHDTDAALLDPASAGLRAGRLTTVRGTIDAISRDLDAGAPLLYRYPPGHDGLRRCRRSLPAVLFLARPSARPQRTSTTRRQLVRRSPRARQPRSGSTPRRWTPSTARPPRQLPAGPDPRRPGSGRPGSTRCSGQVATSAIPRRRELPQNSGHRIRSHDCATSTAGATQASPTTSQLT